MDGASAGVVASTGRLDTDDGVASVPRSNSNAAAAAPMVAQAPRCVEARLLQDGAMVRLRLAGDERQLSEGKTSDYPAIYLRDNCASAVHPTTFQRTVAVWELPADLRVADVAVAADGGAVTVTFSDGHRSTFAADWLWQHSLDERSRLSRHAQRATELVPWRLADLPDGRMPEFDFAEVLGDDGALLRFLDTTATLGLVKLTGMGTEGGAVARLAQRVAFLRVTNYGDVFDVRVDATPINQAYTAAGLPLHTDLPFYTLPPGVQVLHCLKQSFNSAASGRSLFVDGLAVARKLRETEPALYDILANTPIVFEDYTPGRFFLKTERPVITEWRPAAAVTDAATDEATAGIPTEVNFNNGVRSSEMNLPPRLMADFYRAMAAFGEIAHASETAVETKLNPGEAVVFQNRRVLHGRRPVAVGADDGAAGERWLQGGYVDLDEVHSVRRLLRGQAPR